jgi:hypothetical protein
MSYANRVLVPWVATVLQFCEQLAAAFTESAKQYEDLALSIAEADEITVE